MQNFIAWLDGKKTFISSGIAAAIGLSYIFDLITTEQFKSLLTLAGAFGLVGIRSALKKLEK